MKDVEFPNQFNIRSVSVTWTLAQRSNGQPLENLGVTPDIPYAITPDDLQNEFRGYKAAVEQALENLFKEQ